MNRRTFLAGTAAVPAITSVQSLAAQKSPQRGDPYRLLYAPHFGMFGNHAKEMEDQLQFAADEGFRAWEDNGMAGRDEAAQARLGKKMEQCSIAMGVFVAHGDFGKPTFASGDAAMRDKVLADLDRACTVADRVRARWCTVVPGTIDSIDDGGSAVPALSDTSSLRSLPEPTSQVLPSFVLDCAVTSDQKIVLEITWKGTPAVVVRDTVSGVITVLDAQCNTLVTVAN